MTPRSRDILGVVIAVTAVAGCIGLGVWQVHRLRWRRERNAAILARRMAPVVELAGQRGASVDSLRERQVRAHGVYDFERERVWGARTWEGVPGVALLTPLRLADGSAIFVDRGWAPSVDAFHVDAARLREPDSATVLGLAFAAPRDRGDVDPRRLADSIPYPVLPFVLLALPDTLADRRLPAGLRRWPAPELSNGPHLSYAIQWFSFAVIIAIGTWSLLRTASRENVEGKRQEQP